MRMLISRERLRQKIENDPEGDVDVGLPAAAFGDTDDPAKLCDMFAEEVIDPPPAILGIILRELRRREGLTVDALATQTHVDVTELRGLEQDPNFRPRPRTIHKLAERLSLPQQELARLAGAVIVNDSDTTVQGLKFAAMSDDLSTLTSVERVGLSFYVDAIMARIKAHP